MDADDAYNFLHEIQLVFRQPCHYEHPVYLVECLKVTDRWGLLGIVGELVLEVSNEHAELCPPVTHMIEPGRGGEGRGGEGRGGEGRGGEGRGGEGRGEEEGSGGEGRGGGEGRLTDNHR